MRDLPALQFGVTFGGLERGNVSKNTAEEGPTIRITIAHVAPRCKPTNFSVGLENAKLELARPPESHSRAHGLSDAGAIFRVNAIEQCFQREPCIGGKAE